MGDLLQFVIFKTDDDGVKSGYRWDCVVRKVIESSPFEIPLIKLYGDDSSLSAPERMTLRGLTMFNNFELKIQFTMESEKSS